MDGVMGMCFRGIVYKMEKDHDIKWGIPTLSELNLCLLLEISPLT